jgi:hypothetical protein
MEKVKSPKYQPQQNLSPKQIDNMYNHAIKNQPNYQEFNEYQLFKDPKP